MTIKQKQCLLAYLGYYTGAIDGSWGTQSQQATEAFQRDFLPPADGKFGPLTEQRILEVIASGEAPQQEETAAGDSWWDEIEYFKPAEFTCKCGCGAGEMEEKLIRAADTMRKAMGEPINVSSGRRCATRNAAVGGVADSRHLLGKAMDFSVKDTANAKVEAYLAKIKAAGTIRYWYNISGGWYHMDIT